MRTHKGYKSSMAIAALGMAIAGTSASAQQFQMDFTVTYDSYDYFGDDFQLGLPASLTVIGTVTWDSQGLAFSDNGVNSHYWEFMSYNAVGVGSLGNGTDVGFTINRGPTDGNAFHVIQTVHSPSQNASNMYWRSRPTVPSAFDSISFEILTLGVTAMPDFESPLPTMVEEYESGNAFKARFSLYDEDFNSYDFNQSSISVAITIVPPCIADLNGDGVLNFFDVSAFLNAFSGGCP